MSKPVPAAHLAKKASKPYPGDSDDYRKARTSLLEEEIELRRQIGRVAELRRALPPDGELSKPTGLSPRTARSTAWPICSGGTTR
jgi:predicted dithiol-disulfide oxidoreductase (DUF899 family)